MVAQTQKLITMEAIDKIRTLVDSEHLDVIKVAGHASNLALTTYARVHTKDNSVDVEYSVRNWNDKLIRLDKKFTNYTEADAYHKRLVSKFGKK